MPKLVTNCMFRLRSVSEKLNKEGMYPLVPFKNKAFNKNFDMNEVEIDDVLTNLVNDLYGHDQFGNHWFQVGSDEDKTISLKIDNIGHHKTDDCDRLKIHNTVDLINFGSGMFQFFILFSAEHKEYQWVVVSLYLVYSDCKTREEMGLSTVGVADAASGSILSTKNDPGKQ